MFKDLVKLKIIDLWKNGLTGLPGHLFQTSKGITVIYLGENRMSTLNATLFWGLRELIGLELCQNGLTFIDGYF